MAAAIRKQVLVVAGVVPDNDPLLDSHSLFLNIGIGNNTGTGAATA